MGFFFRKSIGLGPLRINLSKRGIGVSAGVRGFRIGRSSTGRDYTRASIPGTGVGWQSSGSGKSGCMVPLAIGLGLIGLGAIAGQLAVMTASWLRA